MEKNNDLGLLPLAENDYGFDFSFPAEQSQMPYDNKGACDELSKDMKRRDVLSLCFYKDKNTSHACVQVESKNVAPYKLQLNPALFAGLMRYIENGKPFECDPVPMDAIQTDDETYKTDMLRLFVNANKTIQWTPLFRERNGKLSGTHIAKYGKVFFYVECTDELLDWLRERKQAI